jgi:phenylacetate-CoA ligase
MTVEPFYRWLVPRVVSPVAAALGRPVWTTARRLEALQWRPAEELESRAVRRLRTLAEHATRHVPYYRDLFARSGFDPARIRTIRDLAQLPISTKVELRSGFPDRSTAGNIPAGRRQKMMTSGSTGRPFEFYWDRQAAAILGGTYHFWLGWAGTAIWHTRVVIASPSYFYNELAPPRPLRQLVGRVLMGEHNVSLSSDQLTTEGFRAMVAKVAARGPYFIRAYPRAIAGLAARLAEEGIPLARRPKVVVTFAETVTPANVEAITRVFHCQVVNYFSAWEVPQMAQTCPDNPEVLHVNSERVILRVVRPDGTDAAPGEKGQIVVTDLANFVMPFINYSAGDQAVAGAPCSCGRGLPTLGRLEGRDSEVIRTLQGREISGVVLGQFLAFVVGIIPYVWEYQAVQTTPARVTLRVVPTPRFDRSFQTSLEGALGEFLGPGMAATVEAVSAIPLEPSGKRLIIKPLPCS